MCRIPSVAMKRSCSSWKKLRTARNLLAVQHLDVPLDLGAGEENAVSAVRRAPEMSVIDQLANEPDGFALRNAPTQVARDGLHRVHAVVGEVVALHREPGLVLVASIRAHRSLVFLQLEPCAVPACSWR